MPVVQMLTLAFAIGINYDRKWCHNFARHLHMNREASDTQTDRQTGRQADRQTGRQADRQTGRQADRQAVKKRLKYTDIREKGRQKERNKEKGAEFMEMRMDTDLSIFCLNQYF